MTKEEMLKQEAEEWLNKWELCNKCDHKVQCIEDNAMCPQVVERAYLASAEPREKRIAELEKCCANYEMTISKMEKGTCDICRETEKDKKIEELEAQIEKMKKYGKLLQDICTVMGNDVYMVSVGLENRVKVLWDSSEEKEGLKMVEDIENRLLKIKPQEWAEITKWEIKEVKNNE